MHQFEKDREKRIRDITTIVKLLSLIFCGIVIYRQYYTAIENRLGNQNNYYLALATTGIGVGLLFIIYTFWVLYQTRISEIQAKRSDKAKILPVKDIFEILIFISVFSVLIVMSGAHVSQYKYLYIFIITIATMQLGMYYGMGVAALSSIIILALDLIAMPKDMINQYFENDLILAGVFILTAWLLGYYVRVEDNYRDKIEHFANLDGLTELYNHRFFHVTMKKCVESAKKSNMPVSLLFIDIDYFKYYNDLYGHQAGDEILKIIAQILKSNVRSQDIVARYGGEEFAIILPGTSEEQALSIAERIRKKIEGVDFQGEENQPNGRITVSVGVSSFPEKAKDDKELLDSADDALYRAKFFSKNRVESYYSILEEIKTNIGEEHADLVASIKTLISVINAKDRYTYGHTERVVIYCGIVANELKLDENDKKILKFGAYLHDIGKINITKDVLNKKMPLTQEEWEILKQHPVSGVDIIKPVDSLKGVIPLILHHHERYDGKGYPMQLKGEEIPYLTRILSIADSFDAMTSSRPYKPRKTYGEAIVELRRCSGTQFDPELVEVFINAIVGYSDHFDMHIHVI